MALAQLPEIPQPAAAKAYTPPLAADGHPDLQGVWDFRNVIPLERPSQYAGKEFLTDEEAAEFEKSASERFDMDRRDDDPTRTGNTLVVETRGFHEATSFPNSSPNMHLIEKFSRIDPDTLVYQFTVSDPATWTKPFTAQVPMRKSDQSLYEYACHEGNYAMTGILGAARAVENAAGEAAEKGSR